MCFFTSILFISFVFLLNQAHFVNITMSKKLEACDDTAGFPNWIHFIWVEPFLRSDQPTIPPDVEFNINEWKVKNPCLKVKLWRAKDILENFPDLFNFLRKIPNSSWISNILRYKLSYEYGGLYLDTDIRAFRSVQPIMRRFNTGFVVCEWPPLRECLEDEHCKIINNAVIASRKNDPKMKDVFLKSVEVSEKELLRNNLKKFVYSLSRRVTGPQFLDKEIKNYTQLHVLCPSTFSPCSYVNLSKCVYENFSNRTNIYGMHQWKKRWDS